MSVFLLLVFMNVSGRIVQVTTPPLFQRTEEQCEALGKRWAADLGRTGFVTSSDVTFVCLPVPTQRVL